MDKVYPLISKEQEASLKDAIKITFTGDLILLREMVERSFNRSTGKYEFAGMFEHATDIWKSSDLAIGVFEGPLCGVDYGYSTSNFDDNIPLALNFPDSFAQAVKDAGINLVSLANNHIFDMGVKAGMRTIEVLDKIGLNHVGLSYDAESFLKPKIIELSGKKIGILAYTYGQNGKSDDFFFDKSNCFVKPVVSVNSKYFKRNYELIKEDFIRLKAENPDLIIVLPHMGRQFLSKPDKTQRRWCKIFADLGADIIFADHSHHVQPIEWLVNKDGKQVLTVYCPGNLVNSFVGHDGDASMIVSAYLDRNTLKPFAVAATPIYAHCPQNGSWTALPTYEALTNQNIYNSLSRSDFKRINRVNRLVTRIAFGTELDVNSAQKEYMAFPEAGFVRQSPPKVQISDFEAANSSLIERIKNSNSICFVGDSITDGTKNGGFGWYEPLMSNFSDKRVSRYAKGSKTSVWLVNNANRIAEIDADLYVIAIGCNDIRYRDPKICAMSPQEYIDNLKVLVNNIREHSPSSSFIFIAPWRSLNFDANFNVKDHSKRIEIYNAYTQALEEYCRENQHLSLNPNPYIFQDLESPDIRLMQSNDILTDFIHPNAHAGIAAYSKAVLQCSCHTISL